jgi:hypothetical protein
MNRSVRAELVKLWRPMIVFGGGGAFILFGVLATMLTFVTAKAEPARFSVATAGICLAFGARLDIDWRRT